MDAVPGVADQADAAQPTGPAPRQGRKEKQMNAKASRTDKPVKADVGDETDVTQTAFVITPRDVRAVMVSAAPVSEKLAELEAMKREVDARVRADPDHDLEPIANEIDQAIDRLGRQDPE